MGHLKNNRRRIYSTLQLAAIFLWLGMLASVHSGAIELDDYDVYANEMVYISPTRLKQSPHDTPASVSKITQQTIRHLQLNNVPEIFRYIAGMTPIRIFGYTYAVGYHKTNVDAPQRMLVLIDGISIYRPFYNPNSWSTLPLSIDDIDYIEVTRSPSAATYGVNSLLAVINIITKDPLASPAFSANITDSGDDYHRLNLSFSGKMSPGFAYRISATITDDEGFDNRLGNSGRVRKITDGHDIKQVNSTVSVDIGQSTNASLSWYYNSSVQEVADTDNRGRVRNNIDEDKLNIKHHHLSGKLHHVVSANHDMTLRAHYTRLRQTYNPIICHLTFLLSEPLSQLSSQNYDYAVALLELPFANPSDVPTSDSPQQEVLKEQFLKEADEYFDTLFNTATCFSGSFNSLEEHFSVELEDTYLWSENLRFVSGFGANHWYIDSATYFQGDVSSTTYRTFANAEARLNRWVFNAGAMLEYNDEAYDKTALSPRFGANYRIDDHSTLRFIVSKAVQIPDLPEREFNRSLYAENFTPPYPVDQRTEGYLAFYHLTADDDLKSQRAFAREVSLYTKKRYPADNGYIDASSDIKLFYNRLSFRPSLLYSNTQDISDLTLRGLETDITVAFNQPLSDTFDHVALHINLYLPTK